MFRKGENKGTFSLGQGCARQVTRENDLSVTGNGSGAARRRR